MSTIQTLITRVQRELSQAAGSGVQLYSQDILADAIVSAFNIVFLEDFWPDYSDWVTPTLDGSTGIITSNISIRRFKDIRMVKIIDQDRSLPHLPRGVNPYLLTGTTPLYVEGRPNATGQTRPFRIWPLASTGQLAIHGRVYPSVFSLDTDILFPDDLIAYGAAWQYSCNDGHNPSQIGKFQKLFETVLKQEQREVTSNLPTKLDPRLVNIPTTWQEIS